MIFIKGISKVVFKQTEKEIVARIYESTISQGVSGWVLKDSYEVSPYCLLDEQNKLRKSGYTLYLSKAEMKESINKIMED